MARQFRTIWQLLPSFFTFYCYFTHLKARKVNWKTWETRTRGICFNKNFNLDSGTDVFLWTLRNFKEHLFYRTPPMAASVGKYLSYCTRYHAIVLTSFSSIENQIMSSGSNGFERNILQKFELKTRFRYHA